MSRECILQGSDYTKNSLKGLSQRVPGLELQMSELIPVPRRGMYAAELCPLVGKRDAPSQLAWGISFQWNREGFIRIWMYNSHSSLMSPSPTIIQFIWVVMGNLMRNFYSLFSCFFSFPRAFWKYVRHLLSFFPGQTSFQLKLLYSKRAE